MARERNRIEIHLKLTTYTADLYVECVDPVLFAFGGGILGSQHGGVGR